MLLLMNRKQYSFLLTILFCSISVHGWGPDGHSLVASIAQTLLSNQSLTFVRTHLPWYTQGNLSMLASWPDFIIYPDTNPVDYLNWQWSKELHYVNTIDWSCVYNRDQDCRWSSGRNCVDGSIQNYTSRLADSSEDDVQREQALKFLVHFIGDAHQPLHAGFQGDEGGNLVKGKFFDKETNLHSVWDTAIIEKRIKEDFNSQAQLFLRYLIDQMTTKYAVNISEWSQCTGSDESKYLSCADKWISEDSKINCDLVYRDEQNQPMNPSKQFQLGAMYYSSRLPIVEQRLIQAGVRLANVINQIAEANSNDPSFDDYTETNRFLLLFLMVLVPCFCMSISCVIIPSIRKRNRSKV